MMWFNYIVLKKRVIWNLKKKKILPHIRKNVCQLLALSLLSSGNLLKTCPGTDWFALNDTGDDPK